MDQFFDTTWREHHPHVTALHDTMKPPFPHDYYEQWNILYAQVHNDRIGNMWIRLTKGAPGNPDTYWLSIGQNKENVGDWLAPRGENEQLFETYLSDLIHEAYAKFDIDLLSINNWEVISPYDK